MRFCVNKEVEFPIYEQLKEQIKYFLLSGSLKAGEKIPSPKELEKYLKINRNTVISAYKELEQEGLLISKRGQGTYVSDIIGGSASKKHSKELLKLADDVIEKTRQLGFKAEDLFTVIFNKTMLETNDSRKLNLRALLVECNTPDLEYFRKVLVEEININIDTCLLSDLQGNIDSDILKNCAFVITGINHIEEVKAAIEPLKKEVIGFMAAPQIHTFMRIAQLGVGTKVAIVCAKKYGALKMKKAIEAAGIHHIMIFNSGTDNKKHLLEVLKKVDVVIASRVAYDDVKTLLPKGVQLFEFFSELDRNGIEMLKQYINNKFMEDTL